MINLIHKSREIIHREIKALFQLKKTERLWHVPALASLCTGLPLLIAYYFSRLDLGVLSCMGGLVILYLPSTRLEHRMKTLLFASFAFVISFAIGLGFCFNPIVSALVIGIYAIAVNMTTNYLRLPPPGNFFFIMLASMAACMPYDLHKLPVKVALLALGTLLACVLALLYSLYIMRKIPAKTPKISEPKRTVTNFTESTVIGLFIGLSIYVGRYFRFDNPYWIPISCLAIMQGMNARHVGQRSFHRILGTVIGMGLSWFLLHLRLNALSICLCIFVLQFIIELLIVRQYALTVIFITPMTMFLAEIARGVSIDPDKLILTRLFDIVIGSIIGLVGGLILHNHKLHTKAALHIKKVILSRH